LLIDARTSIRTTSIRIHLLDQQFQDEAKMNQLRLRWSEFTGFLIVAGLVLSGVVLGQEAAPWESSNPIVPIPDPPLGIGTKNNPPAKLTDFPDPPTPERVRLGRWLFFDKRLSADNTIACATCHRPENAFSEPTPVSTGIRGQKGGRKAPSFTNQAWTSLPHFFWDGRSASLEDQAGGPMINPIEMGNKNHKVVVARFAAIRGYAKYFKEAFGTEKVTIERITKAIADYERTRMSGNSPWDKYVAGDKTALSDEAKKGRTLFFGNGFCNNCHKGPNLTDSEFHNIGVGWDAETEKFADDGRYAVTKKENDKGAFKTPSLRDVSKRAPYMHDGSLKTLAEVVILYSKGGVPNPQLDRKIDRRFAERLDFTEAQVTQLVKFMEALNGEGYQDTTPTDFPQ
jgi:cytochrome c peroxidase